MEASGATTDPGTGTDHGTNDLGTEAAETQTPEAQEGQQFDPTALTDRMGEMERTFLEKLGSIDERLNAPAEENEPQEQVYVNPETGDIIDQYGNPVEEPGFDPEQFEQEVDRRVEAKLQEQLSPILERFQEADLEALEERYPALRTREGAEPVIRAAQAQAEKFARGNPQFAEGLVQDPSFIELVHLAELARTRAEQETPAGAQPATPLENGSAHVPAQPQQGVWDRIAQEPQQGTWGRS